MLQISKFAPWGAWSRFAKFAPKPHALPTHLPRLPAKLARDIGLTDSDQDRLHVQWPSEGPDRPLL